MIVQYKEIELNEDDSLSQLTKDVLVRLRERLATTHFSDEATSRPQVKWLPCHAIQLQASGELKAHVDSIRFSGDIVAGLSLKSSSIMRLQPAPPEEVGDGSNSPDTSSRNQDSKQEEGHVDLLLPPRSLYALCGASRYLYTHELLEDQAVFRPTNSVVAREDRFSIIFRDEKAKD